MRRVLVLVSAFCAISSLLGSRALSAQGNGWWERITVRGDLRVRYEGFYQSGSDTRHRERFRLRLGLGAPLGGGFEVGVRLATGVPGAITSTNQTLDDAFAPKSFNIDQAYLRYRPADFLHSGRPILAVTAGKFSPRYARPSAGMASELLFDGDLSPEGVSQEIAVLERDAGTLRRLMLVGEQWTVDEVSSGPDGWILVEQARADLSLGASTALTLSGSLVHTANAFRLARARNSNSQLVLSNSVELEDGTIVPGGVPYTPSSSNPVVDFAYGFTVVGGAAALKLTPAGPAKPVGLFAEFAHNADAPDDNNGYVFGASVGNARAPGEWDAAIQYTRIGTDAVLSMINGSDMGAGGTNVKGFIVNADVQVARGVTLIFTDYIVKQATLVTGGSNPTLHRIHVALQTGF